ncbi:hypothetical protein PIROE2DRAFT_9779 [Piromyces sp. E2]|nr:hypothetical protein PIROE2DRAFT_9779 [Piromyces sp. E2]|eukprot:OUM63636.1 hypothetical protein PIROE2DRAFT_9779 [Piromyces sp. E2]
MGLFSSNKKKKTKSQVKDITKGEYIKKLRNLISTLDNEILKEEYIEIKIIQWSRINSVYFSKPFDLCGHQCVLLINKDEHTVDLIYDERKKNEYHLSNIVYVFPVTNYETMEYKSYELYEEDKEYDLSIIEDDKINIGIYWRIYLNEDKGQDNLMEKFNVITSDIDNKEMNTYYYENRITDVNSYKNINSGLFKFNNIMWEIELIHVKSIDDLRDDFLHEFRGETDYYCVKLTCQKYEDNDKNNYYFKYIPFMCNVKDFSCVKYRVSDICTIDSDKEFIFKTHKLISDKGFFKNRKYHDKPIIYDNRAIFGVYINMYKNSNEVTADTINKDKMIKNLNLYVNDEDNQIISKGYYEFSFNNWQSLRNENKITSPLFEICNHKWEIILYPNGINEKSKDNLSVYVRCLDTKQDIFLHLSSKIIFTIRKNISSPITNGDEKFSIGIYIRIYKFKKEHYFKEINDLEMNVDYPLIGENYYEWKIKDYNQKNDEELISSPEFEINDYKW